METNRLLIVMKMSLQISSHPRLLFIKVSCAHHKEAMSYPVFAQKENKALPLKPPLRGSYGNIIAKNLGKEAFKKRTEIT